MGEATALSSLAQRAAARSSVDPYERVSAADAAYDSVARREVQFYYDNTKYAAGTPLRVLSPVRGYVTAFKAVVDTLTAGAGVVTVKNGVAGPNITGLHAIAVANAAAVGTVVSARIEPIAAGLVAKGGVVEIVVDATPTAGELMGWLEITPEA